MALTRLPARHTPADITPPSVREHTMTHHTPPALPRLLTISEVAELLKVSTRSVRRWIDARELPVYRLGRNVRISEVALRDFLDNKGPGQTIHTGQNN